MCFYMVIHMVTAPREDQGRNGLITSVKIVPIRGHLPHFGQDIMEEHCSAYALPTRGVIAIVATAISQVKSSSKNL